MGDRCMGHCCKVFPLGADPDKRPEGFGPDELAEIFRAQTEGREPKGNDGRTINDLEIIYPMIRYLGEKVDPPIHVYDCAHLQEGGDCGIYETRPEMCRDYPHGRLCSQPDCAWDDVRDPDTRLKVVA